MYQTLTSYNLTDGPQILLCYVNDVTTGVFIHGFLIALWLVMVIGTFMYIKRTSREDDFPVAIMVGSWTTMIVAILFRLISCGTEPLTSNVALALSIVLSFIAFMWLYSSRN